jgi:hypothetical protein
MDTDYTLTYSESSQGFPSFYSYYPDWMIGMNNYFYSFKGGNLYRHNTNEARNEFYGQLGASSITTVLNKQPLENKLFKTIAIEGTDAWIAQLSTDVGSQSGVIISTDFEEKEGNYFAYIRNEGVDATNKVFSESDYKSRTLRGLGTSISAASSFFQVNGKNSSLVNTNDLVYAKQLQNDYLFYVGKIETITYSSLSNTTAYVIDPTGGTPPMTGMMMFTTKNTTAESTGLMGHYCEIKLSLPSNVTDSSELFAIGSDVMKSYP